jgi:hypothetical protein
VISDYFARDYTGGAFVLFGRDHLAVLALVAVVCVLIYLLREKWSTRGKLITRWILFGLIYLCERFVAALDVGYWKLDHSGDAAIVVVQCYVVEHASPVNIPQPEIL